MSMLHTSESNKLPVIEEYIIDQIPVDFFLRIQLNNFNIEDYFQINITRVLNNILSALKFLKKQKLYINKYDTWKEMIFKDYNKSILIDCFYLVLLVKNKDKFDNNFKTFLEIEEVVKARVSVNYVSYIEAISEYKEKENYVKIYFDIIAQGVYYMCFYAFPKSRKYFGDSFQLLIFNYFSYFFTGMHISPNSRINKYWWFIKDWYLDLGAGNIFEVYKSKFVETNNNDNNVSYKFPKIKNNKSNKCLQYSPLTNIYVNINKYKTKNYVKPLKIKLSENNYFGKDMFYLYNN